MNNEFSLIVLFTLGLFSTLHCIGMCGGIISALTFSLDKRIQNNKAKLAVYIIAYNTGRIMSYVCAGLVIGALGASIVGLIGKQQAHQVAMYLSAVLMIAVGFYVAGWFPMLSHLDKIGAKFWKRIQPLSQRFMPVKKPWQALGFGAIWGWLPCGLVYTALLLAAFGGNAINGGLGMLAFGLGTLPAVISAGMVAGTLNQWLHQPRIRQVLGLMLVGLGVLSVAVPMDHSQHSSHQGHPMESSEVDHSHHH